MLGVAWAESTYQTRPALSFIRQIALPAIDIPWTPQAILALAFPLAENQYGGSRILSLHRFVVIFL